MDFGSSVLELVTHPTVASARQRLRELAPEVLTEQVRLAAIPAPTRDEGERARYLEGRFRELALQEVHQDAVGNVLGRLPAGGSPGGAAALVVAHLDTVFPRDTPLVAREEGERIHLPGITDNCRGLTALLATARVLVECEIRTPIPLWFVGTVGEEGSGDLYGVKHLFRADGPFPDAAAVLSLDGSGVRRIVHRGLGSKRLRATFSGPGGHSWSDFGNANAIHALGSAVASLAALELPTDPIGSLTVARCGGGSSINAVPAEAWLELDLRSEGVQELAALEDSARKALEAALSAENRRRRKGSAALSLRVEVIGDRPSGRLAEDAPLVRAAVEATLAIGAEPELVASSTDANVPLARGIPALTIGAGGESGGIHTIDEWYEDRQGAEGLERALLVAIAAAGGVLSG